MSLKQGEGEYNTNVPDKEERKRIRRARVEARNTSSDPEAGDKRKDAADETQGDKGQQQIANSLAHLDKKKSTGIDSITMIRVEADWRESQRRIGEEKQRQDRLRGLQEEAVRSGKQNATVEMRWAELLEQNMPQELHNEIESQKRSCKEIIDSKDDLIRTFNIQLKTKDEEYVKSLKQQSEDIEELLGRMRREFKELQEEYEIELENIEGAFMAEREELLSSNKSEIDSLFDRRRESELAYMEAKQKREETYQQEIEDLIVHDHEEYNKLKIKLETDIQTLEQQLEEMQATYQLNTEKLEYNYRVLTERDNENSNTLGSLKRKQNKLKDTLSALVQRYHETDTRDRKKNDELTEEYRRITKQYKDLQAKFRHFELSDNKRFDQLWAMHDEEVMKTIDKVLQADSIITTQQLGWQWRAPNLDALKHPAAATVAAPTTVVVNDDDSAEAEDPAAKMVSGAKMKAVLELLASEAGFLVDKRVRDALESLPPAEAELVQAESTLKALGVESEADVTSLIAFFFPAKKDEDEGELNTLAGSFEGTGSFVSGKTGGDGEGDDGDSAPEAFKVLQRLIQPDDVIRAITAFVDARKANAAEGGQEGDVTGGVATKTKSLDSPSGATSGPNMTSAAGESSGAAGPGPAGRREETAYWGRAAGVISEDTTQVWSQLEKALTSYNQVLTDRANCIDEVTSLQQQNDSLKDLLQTYLGARVNEELIVPPNQTISLN